MKPIDEILSDFNIEPEYLEDCKDYALSILSDIMNDKYYSQEKNEQEFLDCVLMFYKAYKTSQQQGFSPLWSKLYASHFYKDNEDEARAEAYSELLGISLNQHHSGVPQNEELIYQEAYKEGLRRFGNEEYANTYAYQLAEVEPLQKVESLMKIFDKKVKEGKSTIYSQVFAEHIVDEHKEKYSEIYSTFYEEAILSGLPIGDANDFAEKKTDDYFGFR